MRPIHSIPGAAVLALSLLLTILALPGAAAAQDAAATPGGTPSGLGAAECTVDPIDPESYGEATLAATPQADQPDVSTGEPADEATAAAITDTIEQSVACTNAGDLARLLAVIDPSYAPTLLGVPTDQVQAALDAAVANAPGSGGTATPLVDDDDQSAIMTTLLGISDIVVFPDGRAAATVGIDSPQTGPVTTIIYLRRDGGTWVITDYVFLPSEATPAA